MTEHIAISVGIHLVERSTHGGSTPTISFLTTTNNENKKILNFITYKIWLIISVLFFSNQLFSLVIGFRVFVVALDQPQYKKKKVTMNWQTFYVPRTPTKNYT